MDAATQPTDTGPKAPPAAMAADSVQCAADNGGITLPDGFCAAVFADRVEKARHWRLPGTATSSWHRAADREA